MARSSRNHRDYDRLTGIDADLRFLDDDALGEATGECAPPIDVLETAEAVEVLMDVPGVALDAIRLHVVQGTLIITGRKRPAVCPHSQAAFHLAERTFGRFARAVRISGAFDAGRATATLVEGELRVILPRIEERRGHDIRIEITRS